MSDEIINRVANSALISIDLDDYYPEGERVHFDMKDLLFQGLILREKEFRAFVAAHDWSQYQGKYLAVFCSADAIIPSWAIMVLASKFQPYVRKVVFGTPEELEKALFSEALSAIKPEIYQDAKVVVKGCGKHPVSASAFAELTHLLVPYVSSLMYGEPCSTVPVYKKRN
jgi:hypothetical protein